MYIETYHMLATRQATYWWHRARRAMGVGLLRRYGVSRGCRWLDLGCGPGGNLGMLNSLTPELVVGVDLSPIACGLAKTLAPGAVLVRADIGRGLPFSDDSFDLVTILNVLYHAWIGDDAAVVGEAVRVLRRGGLILVTEPAFSFLAREMDAIGMAVRRYRRSALSAICQAAGAQVLFSSYFTSFGFPLLLGRNAVYRLASEAGAPNDRAALDMKQLSRPLNETLFRLAVFEGDLISRGIRMPFGTTVICVARK
jgi:SAM-dependent methyltransferase